MVTRPVLGGLWLALIAASAVAADDIQAARDLMAAGNYREADKLLREAAKNPSLAAEANYLMYVSLRDQGKLERAVAKLEKAAQLDPERADWRVELGNALLQQGTVDEAMMQFVGALTMNPSFVQAHVGLAQALAQKGLRREAEVQAREALRLDPHSELAWTALCELILQSGRALEAIQTGLQAPATVENSPRFLKVMGQAYEQLGEPGKAIDVYGRAAKLSPKDAEVQLRLGRMYQLKGEHSKAIAAFRAAAALRPEDPAPHVGQAWSLLAMPRGARDAINAADRALHLAPTNLEAKAARGWALYLLRQEKMAVQVLTEAATTPPGSPEAMYYLGLIARNAGNKEEALEWLRKASAEGLGTPIGRQARAAVQELEAIGGEAAAVAPPTITPTVKPEESSDQ